MKKLLQLLEDDCTLSSKQLAALANMTEEEIENTKKQLEADGTIQGYKAIVDWDRIEDENVTALIEVKVTPQRGDGFDRIAERIYQFDEVESMYLMSGAFDFTVIISGKSLKQVALFVSEKLSVIDGVVGTSTHFILKKYKEKHLIFSREQKQEERFVFE